MTSNAISKTNSTGHVEVHVDGDPGLPDIGHEYLHCARCLEEWTDTFQDVTTPKDYARQQASVAKDGRVQIWCVRHGINIVTFTFSNQKGGR